METPTLTFLRAANRSVLEIVKRVSLEGAAQNTDVDGFRKLVDEQVERIAEQTTDWPAPVGNVPLSTIVRARPHSLGDQIQDLKSAESLILVSSFALCAFADHVAKNRARFRENYPTGDSCSRWFNLNDYGHHFWEAMAVVIGVRTSEDPGSARYSLALGEVLMFFVMCSCMSDAFGHSTNTKAPEIEKARRKACELLMPTDGMAR